MSSNLKYNDTQCNLEGNKSTAAESAFTCKLSKKYRNTLSDGIVKNTYHKETEDKSNTVYSAVAKSLY